MAKEIEFWSVWFSSQKRESCHEKGM